MAKRVRVSAEQAVSEISRFVDEQQEDSDNDDLDDLVGDIEEKDAEQSCGENSPDNSKIDDLPPEAEGPTRRKHRRKMLTYQRKVHDIESAFDEQNYNMVEPVEDI